MSNSTMNEWTNAYENALKREIDAIKRCDFKSLKIASNDVFVLSQDEKSLEEYYSTRTYPSFYIDLIEEDLIDLENGFANLESDPSITEDDWNDLPYDVDEVVKNVYLSLSERGLVTH